MTAPEQLKAWHEDFEKALPIGERHRLPSQGYASFRIEFEWRGYLRAKQETEQALKDARKQALGDVLKLAEDHRLDFDGSEYHRGWRNASIRFAKLIERLLK